jgi:hypothetical protein
MLIVVCAHAIAVAAVAQTINNQLKERLQQQQKRQ